MAKIPLILHLAAYSQILPSVALVMSRQRTRPAMALAIGGGIGVIGDLVGRWLATHAGNNHITTYLDAPIITVCFLAALREWQLTVRERRVFTIGALVFLVTWVLLVTFVEDMWDFNRATGPLYALTLMAAAVWTLIRRAGAVEATHVDRSDWFWGCVGIAVYGGCTAASEPIGGILLARGRTDLFMIAWEFRGAFMVLGYLLISWGIYWGPAVSKFATVE